MRKKRLIAGGVAVVLAAGITSVTLTARAGTQRKAAAAKPALSAVLKSKMDALAFQQVLDLRPGNTGSKLAASAAKPISQQPQLDATVLELDAKGAITRSATVLMSPQYPHGVVVPVDKNHHTTGVRWRQWDDTGWYKNRGKGTVDIVPGRTKAKLDFMSPYPASVLKLMVNFGVLRLVDQKKIKLTDKYSYKPTETAALCGGASSAKIGDYLDKSLTESSNAATCALVKMLWDRKAIDKLNKDFQDLGLETLQLKNSNPANGGRWGNPITMTSLDTAKLLAIVNGGAGTLWKTPAGKAVTKSVLSDASRKVFMTKLGEQGWNWTLSTANFCGRKYPAAGIPQKVATRWVGTDGKVTVAGSKFGQDVRPCNTKAEVTYAHKPGWVGNSANDAGIVKSLPGKKGRHYIVAVFSNLGDQYQDKGRPATPSGTVAVQHTQKLAQLGAAIDAFEASRS